MQLINLYSILKQGNTENTGEQPSRVGVNAPPQVGEGTNTPNRGGDEYPMQGRSMDPIGGTSTEKLFPRAVKY